MLSHRAAGPPRRWGQLMDRLNPRFLAVKESATLAINQRARALRLWQLVCHLGFGESPFSVPSSMVEALKTHAGEKPICLVTAFQTFGKPRKLPWSTGACAKRR